MLAATFQSIEYLFVPLAVAVKGKSALAVPTQMSDIELNVIVGVGLIVKLMLFVLEQPVAEFDAVNTPE